MVPVLVNDSKIAKYTSKIYTKSNNRSKLQLTQLFFIINHFNLNFVEMALPQGAYAACKLREQFQEKDMIVSRLRAANISDKIDNNAQREYSPAKYNDKLMNSIWGLYNRYSPHNVKKNEYAPPKF
ncbi:uncharacterized protein LOC6579742 isoform X2 [Drosophila mojavensis]|uniref:Uncharacterized protein n=1 Tax=Drosophila mojavensis TaxID=7230 RepID=B4KT39_DROMO|nr:uncharacterized protein LOC6579742 isoform X2 [Drosophila mojavensis]EDW09559.2 uncharacterized protein Dmoj_GI20568 [Drosophila mojavensis]